MLFIWNIVLIVSVAVPACIGGLASGLAATSGVLDLSDIKQSFSHDESSSISQLIKGKSRDLQQLLKYHQETLTFVFIILSLAGVLPIIFDLYLTL